MRLSQFLISHARGQGKTHRLALLVKELGGTLIVRDAQEANRVMKTYGVHTVPYSTNTRHIAGRTLGITYVDPDAAGKWVEDLEHENALLRKQVQDLQSKLQGGV